MTIKIKNKKTTAIITTIGLAMSAGFIIGIGGWFGGGASIPADTMTRGLVGYWSFDEGMGDTAYNAAATGSVNDGALGDGTAATKPSWSNGKKGGALDFDGSATYVNCGTDTSLNIIDAITIEAWVKTTNTGSFPNANQIYSISNEVVTPETVFFDTEGGCGRILFRFANIGTAEIRQGTVNVADGEWHHIILTRDGTTAKLYVDGSQDGVDLTLSSSAAFTLTGNAYIGKFVDNADNNFFDGSIDEVRIYDRALSAEEIRYHYNRGGPVAEYKFNTGSGSTAYDTSGSVPGHDATIHSCPEGYIPIPGNSDYGTEDGFCVMKYEAKCTGSENGNTCSDTSGIPISQQANMPWRTNISQTEAKEACERAGAHLITNNEWMTIARNIEATTINDLENVVDGGLQLATGQSENVIDYSGSTGTYTAVESSVNLLTDDTKSWDTDQWKYGLIYNTTDGKGQYCWITSNTATTVSCTLSGSQDWDTNDTYKITICLPVASGADPVVSGCDLNQSLEHADNAYVIGSCELRGDGGYGEDSSDKGFYGTGQAWTGIYSSGGANDAQLRTHVLSNGEVIWDLSGNVWEWTDDTIAQDNQPGLSTGADDAEGGGGWGQFTEIDDFAGLSSVQIEPADTSLTSTNGVGKIWTYGDAEIVDTLRAFRRGGSWNFGSDAGAFALCLSYLPSLTRYYVGFRCSR